MARLGINPDGSNIRFGQATEVSEEDMQKRQKFSVLEPAQDEPQIDLKASMVSVYEDDVKNFVPIELAEDEILKVQKEMDDIGFDLALPEG